MITTTSQIAPPVTQSFLNKMLSTPVPYIIHGTAAMRYTMPAQGGSILRMRRADRLPVSTVPLGNSGLTPAAFVPQVTDLDAEIQYYGAFILLNEQVVLTAQDPVLNWTTELLGIQLKETEDVLIRNMLQGTASQIDCVAGINGQDPTEMTLNDLNVITTALFSANALTISNVIEGSLRFGTSPVNNSFFGMANTALRTTLLNMDGFTTTAQYPQQANILETEAGQAGYVRFLLSSIGSITPNASSAGNDVLNCFIAGMESYGVINQDKYAAKFLYIPPEIAGGPLALNAALGWKTACAQRILNDALTKSAHLKSFLIDLEAEA